MTALSNAEIAALLEAYGALLELSGENSFRARAYARAAAVVRERLEPVAALAAAGRLRQLPGIGEGIASALSEIVQTGTFASFEALKQAWPMSLLDLLALPGIGAKTVARLHRELGVSDLDSLEAAAVGGRLRDAKGFGPRLEAAALAGLEAIRQRSGRMPIGVALPQARAVATSLRRLLPGRVEVAGSVRRFAETAGDLDFVVEAFDPSAVVAAISTWTGAAAVERLGPEVLRLRLQSGADADLYVCSPERFGLTLVRATGPPPHVARLGPIPDTAAEEADVYAAVGLPWIPPELRAGGQEFDRWAEIPRLVGLADIRGELHCHSTWSDGTAPIAEMAAAAADRGYDYLAITDHSRSLGVAGGLDVDRLRAQGDEIAALTASTALQLLAGSEVEVDRAGGLDFDRATLAALDVVVASLHVGLRQEKHVLTERLIGVVRNPDVDVIAHPSGRLIERRLGGDFDWPRVFAAAADTGTILEINADPARLDLNRVNASAALAAGCLLAINCDAHHPDGFALLEYGVAVARQAWATPDQIANAWPRDRLLDWLSSRR